MSRNKQVSVFQTRNPNSVHDVSTDDDDEDAAGTKSVLLHIQPGEVEHHPSPLV